MAVSVVLVVLAVNVAVVYFAIAAVVVPKLALTGADPRFEVLLRVGLMVFAVGGGISHLIIALRAGGDPSGGDIHQLWAPGLQLVGGWGFVFAAVRFLDIGVNRRSRRLASLEREARVVRRSC